LASIHLERNELKTAEDYLERGIDLCKQGGLDGVFSGILLRARLRQARGDFESALGEIHFLEQNFPKSDSPGKLVREFQIRLALGDAACASLLAGPLVYVLNLPEDKSGLPVVAREILQVLLARMLLAQGNYEQAHRLLGECQATAEPGKRFGHLIEVYLLRALAFQKQNNGVPTSQAVDAFTVALELAEPEGYVLLFLEERQAVISLLQAIVSVQPDHFSTSTFARLQAYAQKLLSNFPGIRPPQNDRASQPDAAAQPAGTLQSESLSQRELEILQLICDGCSNQEIAEKLVISLHTVKKHTSNIFAKLGVSSRTQAAARGHQMNLL
jgi:LuxR family maltose regulon positive regulatory protein